MAASLVAVGVIILASILIVPIPSFDALEQRTGTLVEARRERVSCRWPRECARTMITVRHGERLREYHLGDADPSLFLAGEPITVWAHPEFRHFGGERVWHVEQARRVLRDHESEAAMDRRLRLWLGLLAPVAVVGGLWIGRRYDWQGRPTGV